MPNTSRTCLDASHERMDASQTLHHTCSPVYAAGCMEVWVDDAPDAINGHHCTSDAKGVNNPYLVPAIVTCILRVLDPRPWSLHHKSLMTVEVVISVMQHCLSAKGDQKIMVSIALEQPCMTLVNNAARNQQLSAREVVSLLALMCPSKGCHKAQASL